MRHLFRDRHAFFLDAGSVVNRIRGRQFPLRAVLFGLISILVALPTRAQSANELDVSRCFPRLLQNTSVNISSENTKLAVLSVWSWEMYSSLKATGKLQTVIEDLPIDASFEQASVAVEKMFRKNQVNYDRQTWTGTWETKLDSAAKEIILECLKDQSVSRWGLTYDYRLIDQSRVKLVLHWTWIDGTGLTVETKHIQNATVESNPVDKYKILPYPYPSLRFIQPTLKEGSTEIELKRRSPNEEITIDLDTKPNLRFPIITIPPEHRNECHDVTLSTRADNSPQTFTFSPDITSDSHWTGTDLGDSRHLWTVSHSLSEVIPKVSDNSYVSDVQCMRVGTGLDTAFMDFDRVPNGSWQAPGGGLGTSTAYCSGWWQNLNRRIVMTVSWKRSERQCSDIPWPESK